MAKKNHAAPIVVDEEIEAVNNEETVTEEVEKEEKAIPKKKNTMRGKVVNCAKLNVRKEPSISSEVLSVLSVDTVVVIEDGSDKEWFKIPSGYVMKKFIKVM